MGFRPPAQRTDATQSSDGPVTRRHVLRTTATGIGGLTLFGTATGASASGAERRDGPFADDQVIREDYWVETDRDTDNTGEFDRVHVEIARPESTDDPGTALPVICEPSPYYGELSFGVEPYDMEVELYVPEESESDAAAGRSSDVVSMSEDEMVEFTGHDGDWIGPSPYEETFLEQGYVWAYAASIGTEESTGCLDLGGEDEIEATKAVVDWFNGRATAYPSKTSDQPVEADWTTGETGMIGGSYNGTIPNAIAATGVDGLETIVPMVAISSWYTYYRSEGAVISPQGTPATGPGNGMDTNILFDFVVEDPDECAHVRQQLTDGQDRLTGNYNDYWAERNYVPDADQVEASVLVTHGLYDNNVKLRNASQWIRALDANDVPYKTWFFQGGHGDPLALADQQAQWIDLLTDWFAYWLHGEDTGVMDEPTAVVQREDGSLGTYDDWPDPDSEATTVSPTPGGESTGGLAVGDAGIDSAEETLVDDPDVSPHQLVAAQESPHRLAYWSDTLSESVRLSGTIDSTLRLAFDSKAALVSVALVYDPPEGEPEIVNRGWANPQNRNSLEESLALEPGQAYDIEFPTQPVDVVFEAGSRFGLAVYSSDFNITKRPPGTRELTLSVAESSFDLPVVGGQSALDAALGGDPPSDWWGPYTNDDDVVDSASDVVDAIDAFESPGGDLGAGEVVTLIQSFETGTPVPDLL